MNLYPKSALKLFCVLGEFLYDLSFSGTGLNFKRIASPDDFLIACCTQGICSAF